jgi:hypothetical protein
MKEITPRRKRCFNKIERRILIGVVLSSCRDGQVPTRRGWNSLWRLTTCYYPSRRALIAKLKTIGTREYRGVLDAAERP